MVLFGLWKNVSKHAQYYVHIHSMLLFNIVVPHFSLSPTNRLHFNITHTFPFFRVTAQFMSWKWFTVTFESLWGQVAVCAHSQFIHMSPEPPLYRSFTKSITFFLARNTFLESGNFWNCYYSLCFFLCIHSYVVFYFPVWSKKFQTLFVESAYLTGILYGVAHFSSGHIVCYSMLVDWFCFLCWVFI